MHCALSAFLTPSLRSFPIFTLMLGFNGEKGPTKLIPRTLATKARDVCWDVTLNQVQFRAPPSLTTPVRGGTERWREAAVCSALLCSGQAGEALPHLPSYLLGGLEPSQWWVLCLA